MVQCLGCRMYGLECVPKVLHRLLGTKTTIHAGAYINCGEGKGSTSSSKVKGIIHKEDKQVFPKQRISVD